MALANFFEKNALAASHLLQGMEVARLRAMLEGLVIGVWFDDAAVQSSEGQATLELVFNLLARLYPRIALIPYGLAAEAHAVALRALATAINPEIAIETSLEQATACIAVGETPARTDAPVTYIGSSGWVALLSPVAPVSSANSNNPFGAGAAACFGAANVFRRVFADHLPRGLPDEPFALSLLDYTRNLASSVQRDIPPTNLGETHLVGLGAVGNGTVWALSRAPSSIGTLHLIDEEDVDLGNLQRYVLTTQEHQGQSKVIIAATKLQGTQLVVHPHQLRWGDYLRKRGDWRLERVAVGLDSATDRIAVQAALPKWVANAWTQAGDLGVSRHSFIGPDACLACLYLPEQETQGEERLIAAALGMPEACKEIGRRLYHNVPTDRPLLEQIAATHGISVEPLLAFEGKPLRTFYSKAICGGIVLALGGHGHAQVRAEVPMAFQSALAGILLAAEIVVHAGQLRVTPQPTTTHIDLLKPLGSHFSFPVAKHPSGRCICQDADYVQAYREKWEAMSIALEATALS